MNLTLCTYSKSEIHRRSILPQCPLGLSSTEGKKCPCKKRLYHVPPADLRVISCEYPFDWRGNRISSESVKGRLQKQKPERESKAKEISMEAKQNTELPKTAGSSLAVAAPKSTGLTVYDRIPDPIAFVGMLGQTLYDSKMFGCNNPAQGRALAFGFMVNRIDPFTWRQRHHIIGGNVTKSAEAMLADFRAVHGGSHRVICRTPERAEIEMTLGKGKAAEKQLFAFTWEEAQKEDYVWTSDAAKDPKKRYLPNSQTINAAMLKDNWSTPRRRMQMLWARVISDGVAAMCPEVSSGQQTPEELGVLSSEIQGEIVDAEFTVAPTQQPEPATDETVAPDGEAGEEIDAEFVVTPDAAPADAGVSPPNTPPTATPPAAQPTPQSTPQPDAQPAAGVAAHQQQLAEDFVSYLRELKTYTLDRFGTASEIITKAEYEAFLSKKGVNSARSLPGDTLAGLLDVLRKRAAAADREAGTDPMSQWANNALSPLNTQPAAG